MKSKHLNIDNLPLTIEAYEEMRKGLKLGKLKWMSFSKELQNAYHNFEVAEKESDFEKKIHKITRGSFDFDTPI
jgi:hypothetical protein